MELIFGIVLALIAIAFVGRPLYLAKGRAGQIDLTLSAQGLEVLLTERDTLYESIREVDLDRELGRVTEEDHARHRREYVSMAAAILRRIDALAGEELDRQIESEVARLGDGRSPWLERACPHCGAPRQEGDRFCPRCGRSLEGLCPHCGAAFQPGDRFCRECGNSLEVGAL